MSALGGLVVVVLGTSIFTAVARWSQHKAVQWRIDQIDKAREEALEEALKNRQKDKT